MPLLYNTHEEDTRHIHPKNQIIETCFRNENVLIHLCDTSPSDTPIRKEKTINRTPERPETYFRNETKEPLKRYEIPLKDSGHHDMRAPKKLSKKLITRYIRLTEWFTHSQHCNIIRSPHILTVLSTKQWITHLDETSIECKTLPLRQSRPHEKNPQ